MAEAITWHKIEQVQVRRMAQRHRSIRVCLLQLAIKQLNTFSLNAINTIWSWSGAIDPEVKFKRQTACYDRAVVAHASEGMVCWGRGVWLMQQRHIRLTYNKTKPPLLPRPVWAAFLTVHLPTSHANPSSEHKALHTWLSHLLPLGLRSRQQNSFWCNSPERGDEAPVLGCNASDLCKWFSYKNSFDNWLIVLIVLQCINQTKRPNICWWLLLKCERFLLLLYDCKSKIWGFWSQLTDKPHFPSKKKETSARTLDSCNNDLQWKQWAAWQQTHKIIFL